MKRIIAILTAAVMLLSFAACGKPETPNETKETTTENITQAADFSESDTTESLTMTEETSEAETAQEETSAEVTRSDDPKEWTEEEIVEFYKEAAIKSTAAKSKQTMSMTELVVNDGDGFIGVFVEMVTPLFKSALEKNSTEFDGITGGYEKLSADDVKTAKAYKSGDYTVVEMTMIEQVDGIHGDAKEGTVGHAISVVGDMAVIEEELPMFTIDFENSDLSIRYKNPTLKVKINNKGVIEKGTWSYDVVVNLKNLYIKNNRLPIELTIKSGYGSVAYLITTGGGF